MRRILLTGMLAGMLASGCSSVHKRELESRTVYDTLRFPEPATKTQEIATYLREHGQDGARGAKCGSFHTGTGTLSICYMDLNKPFDYSDDIFYFGFERLDHTCVDKGLDDTLDDVVIDGTATPIPVQETKPEFQKFVQHEYDVVIRKVHREMRREGLL